MVLFSTYRNSRLVSKTFMMDRVLYVRGAGEYYFNRAWNGTINHVIPGEVRLYAVWVPFIYFYHRWHEDHALEADTVERAMIERWGGTLPALRELSPQDQVRARNFYYLTRYNGAFGGKELTKQPAGDTLPGPELYGGGHGHH